MNRPSNLADTENPTRINAWVRAVRSSHWAGQAGRWFRATLSTIGRFGREELKLDEKLGSVCEAGWARAEGSIVGKDQADALLKWQEAENKRIQAKLGAETLDERIAQEYVRTEQAKAEAERTKAETEKVRAETEKLRSEALKIRVDAAIALADRPQLKCGSFRTPTVASTLCPYRETPTSRRSTLN